MNAKINKNSHPRPSDTAARSAARAPVHIRQADLEHGRDQHDIVWLLNEYAKQLVGRLKPLPPAVKRNLILGLQSQPGCAVFLATIGDTAVGIATCFRGFSTFKAKPLVNLHDLAVHPDFQNRGIGGQLIDHVCEYARQSGCCAVTLEVQADNLARRLYARQGFQDLSLPMHGASMLFAKLEIE